MHYSIFFDENEIQLLKSLVGKTIEEIQIPGFEYSVRFLCGKDIFDFTPEGFFTPEKNNNCSMVTRPIITNDCSRVRFDKIKTIAQNFGAIETIQILRTVTVFTPITLCEPTIIGKLEIPTTEGWDNILVHPENSELKVYEQIHKKDLVDLDIGVQMKTTNGHTLHVYTEGFQHWVYGKIDGNLPDNLEGKVKYLSLQ